MWKSAFSAIILGSHLLLFAGDACCWAERERGAFVALWNEAEVLINFLVGTLFGAHSSFYFTHWHQKADRVLLISPAVRSDW
jgi:hypothetical protein